MNDQRIEERVARLERELGRSRWLNRIVGAAALLFLVSSLSRPTDDTLRAGRLELVDDKGRTRIVGEAKPIPRLVFQSESGEGEIIIAAGGREGNLGGLLSDNAPHIGLTTGSSTLVLSVNPDDPKIEERDGRSSAMLSMASGGKVGGEVGTKLLNVLIAPDRAALGICTVDPEDPGSIYDPGVKLLVNAKGEVTTKLGSDKKK